MKRFALLKLCAGGNKVIFDCHAKDVAGAAAKFNESRGDVPPLDSEGYSKIGDITFCVAEFFNPLYTVG